MWQLDWRLWRLLSLALCLITVAAARLGLNIARYSSGFGSMAKDQTAAVVRDALAAAEAEAEAMQLDLLAPGLSPASDRLTEATQSKIVELVRHERAGRPKGARNLATREMLEFVRKQFGDPVFWRARWLLHTPESMAKTLGCTTLEAFDRQDKIAGELARLFYPMLAPIDDKGNAVVPRLTMILGGQHAHVAATDASLPPWERHLAQLEQNQRVIEVGREVSPDTTATDARNGNDISSLDKPGG